jgi:hypothetical protein
MKKFVAVSNLQVDGLVSTSFGPLSKLFLMVFTGGFDGCDVFYESAEVSIRWSRKSCSNEPTNR